jgi:hypothetical protein
MLERHCAARTKKLMISEIFRPQNPQARDQLSAIADVQFGRQPDLKDQERHRKGEDAIGQGIDARPGKGSHRLTP